MVNLFICFSYYIHHHQGRHLCFYFYRMLLWFYSCNQILMSKSSALAFSGNINVQKQHILHQHTALAENLKPHTESYYCCEVCDCFPTQPKVKENCNCNSNM